MSKFNMTILGTVEAQLEVEAETVELAKAAATELFKGAFEGYHRNAYLDRDRKPVEDEVCDDDGKILGTAKVDMIDCDAREIDVMIDGEWCEEERQAA